MFGETSTSVVIDPICTLYSMYFLGPNLLLKGSVAGSWQSGNDGFILGDIFGHYDMMGGEVTGDAAWWGTSRLFKDVLPPGRFHLYFFLVLFRVLGGLGNIHRVLKGEWGDSPNLP